MRRLLSFILFLCAAIGVYAQTDYGLTVAGTEVTSSNAGDILGDGKVSYDAASKTLHLKDAAIQSYGTGIAAKDKITIDLTGNSTIDATSIHFLPYLSVSGPMNSWPRASPSIPIVIDRDAADDVVETHSAISGRTGR